MSNTDFNPSALPGTAGNPEATPGGLQPSSATGGGFAVVAGGSKPAPAASAPPAAAPAAGGPPVAPAPPQDGLALVKPTPDAAPAAAPSATGGSTTPSSATGIQTNVMQKIIKLTQMGYQPDQIQSYLQGKQQALLKMGYTQDDVDKYFGFTLEAHDTTDAHIASSPQPVADDDPLTALYKGVTEDSLAADAYHQITGQKGTVAPQEKGLLSQVARSIGTVAPSLPSIGAMTAAGAAIGAVGGPVGAAVGGVAGFGVGWYLDTFGRNAYADAVVNGGTKSPQEFASRVANVALQSAKETAPVVAMTAVAGPAAGLAEAAGVGAITGTAARVGIELTAGTAVQALITQQLPSLNDVVKNAVMLAGAHTVVGGAAWLKGTKADDTSMPAKQTGQPSPATVTQTMDDALKNYAVTGETPAQAAERVVRETSKEGLATRNQEQEPMSPERTAEIHKAWDAAGIDDYGPAIRTRWYAAAVDDGVSKANELLKNSKGYPEAFINLRKADLQASFRKNPDLYGSNLNDYVTRLDSEPPPSPEARADLVRDAMRPKPMPKLPARVDPAFRTGIEDDLHQLRTQDQSTDTMLRDHISQKQKLTQANKKGSDGLTLDERFKLHSEDPSAGHITDAEEALYEKHAAGMKKLGDALEARAKPFFGEATSKNQLAGGASDLPHLGSAKKLSDLQNANSTSFYATQAVRIQNLLRVVRRGEFMAALRQHPEWNENAITIESTKPADGAANTPPVIPPKNYVTSTEMPGWLMHPDLANALEDFANGGPGTAIDKALPFLSKINKLAVGAMFATPLGALAHMKNLTQMYLVGRGWDNLNLLRTVRTGAAAIVDTYGHGPVEKEILDNGGTLLASHIHQDDLMTFTLKKMGQDIALDPESWDAVAQAWGLKGAKDMGKAIVLAQSKALYGYGDVLYKSRYLELREKGMSPKEAIKEVERFIPNYRLSTKVAGSRTMANMIGSMNIAQFGRFDLARFKAIGNMFKDLASGDKTGQALGQFAAMGVLMFLVKPQLDKAAQFITGNPRAGFSLGGTANLFESGIELAEKPSMEAFYKLIGRTFNPSMTTNELGQQATGVDNFTNKPIAEGGLSQQLIERIAHFGGGLISPLPALTNFPKWVEQGIGITSPSAASVRFQKLQGYTKIGNRWVPSGYAQQRKDNPITAAAVKAAKNLGLP